MRNILGHTHYHHADGDKWAVLFTPDKCENCGGDVQAVNAVNVLVRDAERHGLKRWPGDLPAEGWYCEETGGECCDNCP